jgi:hypothetical protein
MSIYLTFGHIFCPLEVGFITNTEIASSKYLLFFSQRFLQLLKNEPANLRQL